MYCVQYEYQFGYKLPIPSNTISFISKTSNKSLNIGIITFFKQGKLRELGHSKKQIFDIIPYALKNFFAYSKVHGYSFYFLNDELLDDNKEAYWGKIKILLYYMTKFDNNKFDWFFYTDMDYLFTDMYTPFEDTFWGKQLYNESIHIIGVTECFPENNEWKAMSGNFMIRNSALMRLFLVEWYNGYSEFKFVVNPEQVLYHSIFYNPNNIKNHKKPILREYIKNKNMQYINYKQNKNGKRILNPINNEVILTDDLVYYYKNILNYQKWMDVMYLIYDTNTFMTYTSCYSDTKLDNVSFWSEWLKNNNVFGVHFPGPWKPRLPLLSKILDTIYPELFNHEFNIVIERN